MAGQACGRPGRALGRGPALATAAPGGAAGPARGTTLWPEGAGRDPPAPPRGTPRRHLAQPRAPVWPQQPGADPGAIAPGDERPYPNRPVPAHHQSRSLAALHGSARTPQFGRGPAGALRRGLVHGGPRPGSPLWPPGRGVSAAARGHRREPVGAGPGPGSFFRSGNLPPGPGPRPAPGPVATTAGPGGWRHGAGALRRR